MITLYQFPADFDLPNPSPFCFKVESFLRLADLDYTLASWAPNRAPLGKAPVIEVDGELVADSSRILGFLIERFDLELDRTLSDERRIVARAATRILEEHTYWALLYTRWIDEAGWAAYAPVIRGVIPLPWPFNSWIFAYFRRGVRRAAHAQGLVRHPPAEIYRRASEDIEAIATLLGDADFFGGDAPCSHDAGAYAFLEQLAHPLGESPLRASIGGHRSLVDYLARMRERLWADGSANFPVLPTV